MSPRLRRIALAGVTALLCLAAIFDAGTRATFAGLVASAGEARLAGEHLATTVQPLAGSALASLGQMDLDPSTVWLVALVGIVPVVSYLRRNTRRGRGRPTRVHPAKVRYMAARGAGYAEISRRTGLSQDAIALLLSDPRRSRERKDHPSRARIA